MEEEDHAVNSTNDSVPPQPTKKLPAKQGVSKKPGPKTRVTVKGQVQIRKGIFIITGF